MILIKHRMNRISDLEHITKSQGAEIDLRSHVTHPGEIHLAHDAWSEGEPFEPWLERWAQLSRSVGTGPLILNTKEDGLETRVLELLERAEISNFFFLDTALPTLVKWTGQGERRFALRVSQHEPLAASPALLTAVDWLWVDCFGGHPIALDAIARDLSSQKTKICLVSPELQGFPWENLDPERKSQWTQTLPTIARSVHAICTKTPEAWQKRLAPHAS